MATIMAIMKRHKKLITSSQKIEILSSLVKMLILSIIIKISMKAQINKH